MRFTMQGPHDRRLAGSLALGAVLLSATGVAAATGHMATTRLATGQPPRP